LPGENINKGLMEEGRSSGKGERKGDSAAPRPAAGITDASSYFSPSGLEAYRHTRLPRLDKNGDRCSEEEVAGGCVCEGAQPLISSSKEGVEGRRPQGRGELCAKDRRKAGKKGQKDGTATKKFNILCARRKHAFLDAIEQFPVLGGSNVKGEGKPIGRARPLCAGGKKMNEHGPGGPPQKEAWKRR